MKMKIVLYLLVLLCLFSLGSQVALAAKSYHAEQFDVLIDMQADGSFIVTETIVFNFAGGPFTFAFRTLDLANVDEIINIQAGMDGQPMDWGTEPGQVEINLGQTLEVTWHFPPTSDSTHEFNLTYQVQGAIRQEETADVLVWRAIPSSHEYTIDLSEIQILYPPGLVPVSNPALYGVPAVLEADENGALFTTQPVAADTPVDVMVSFPAGSLVSVPPNWQSAQESQKKRTALMLPSGLGAAAISGLLGLAGVVLFGLSFRRETNSQASAALPVKTPPTNLPPALAARLVGSNTSFLGTLFDLARKGVLTVAEGPKKWGSRTFEIQRLDHEEAFRPHEQAFIETLFKKAKNDRVPLTDISGLSYSSKYPLALDQELLAAGLRDQERIHRRNRFLIFTGLVVGVGLLFLVGAFTFVLFLPDSSQWESILGAVIIGFSAGAVAAGLIGLIVAALISTLSDEGARQASAWSSFSAFLHDMTKGKETVVLPEFFERYLPYAAGFGIATEWAKYFQKQSDIPVPEWFQGLQQGIDDGSFVAIMAAITVVDSTASMGGADGGGGGGDGSSGAG